MVIRRWDCLDLMQTGAVCHPRLACVKHTPSVAAACCISAPLLTRSTWWISHRFPLTLPVWVQRPQRQPRLQTVGGAQTRTITLFVLPDSPAIHSENCATHTHRHTCTTRVSKSDILLEKWSGIRRPQLSVCTCASLLCHRPFLFFPLLPVLTCYTCSTLMLEKRSFWPKTGFCARNSHAGSSVSAHVNCWIFDAKFCLECKRQLCENAAYM